MIKIFKKLGKALYSVLDKILISPISRIVYNINRKVDGNNLFERILSRPHYLIVFSLLLAIITFLAVDHKAINLLENESEILSGQPVTVIYNKEKYVVEGVPKKVDVILMGRKSDLYLAKQLGDHEIVLDLSNYKTGEYNVKLKYNHSVESVTYKLDPSTVNVKIYEKVSSVKTLTYDLLNQDKFDNKLNVSEVKLKENEVYVKGSSETLKKVATVKALIDLSTLEITESGTYDIDKLQMVAYDEIGNVIDNVEIVPTTASASIKVDSYYVDLPVKPIPKGNVASGYAIKEANTSVNSVRVYGDQAAIKELKYIKAEIDVEGLNTDKTFNVTISKPNGVRYISDTNVSVNVKVGEETTKELAGISIETKNLGSDYVATTVNVEDTTCVVILKGATEVINAVTPESIKAYVDLSGLGIGTHDVNVTIEGDNPLVSYATKVKSIQIKISK